MLRAPKGGLYAGKKFYRGGSIIPARKKYRIPGTRKTIGTVALKNRLKKEKPKRSKKRKIKTRKVKTKIIRVKYSGSSLDDYDVDVAAMRAQLKVERRKEVKRVLSVRLEMIFRDENGENPVKRLSRFTYGSADLIELTPGDSTSAADEISAFIFEVELNK